MKRFAAFLRGVSPMNCRMPELARAFDAAGFSEVSTVLSSGNVVFGATGTPRAIARKAQAPVLPMRADGASLLLLQDLHLFSAYVPGPKAAAFMVLIERTFGKDVTTRTWDTVRKVCAAGTR